MIVHVGKRREIRDMLRRAKPILGKRHVEADRVAGHLVLQTGDGLFLLLGLFVSHVGVGRYGCVLSLLLMGWRLRFCLSWVWLWVLGCCRVQSSWAIVA